MPKRNLMPRQPSRRTALLAIAAGAAGGLAWVARPSAVRAQPGSPIPALVHRDAGCGCCKGWAAILDSTGRFATEVIEEADMAAIKTRLGVPEDLRSCHTAEIGSYVIEGHVPAADIVRLMETAPEKALGLAVHGMPAGSPGMERADRLTEPYQVTLFDRDGSRSLFASYGGH